MSLILENLFLGDIDDAKNMKFLKKNHITHILMVAAYYKPFYPKSFTYLHIEAEDSETFQLSKYFDGMSDFIDNAIKQKGSVFVHCLMGVSRSPTAIIAYLMKYQKMSFLKSKSFVESKREVFPNEAFVKQLKEYETLLNERRHPWKKNDINYKKDRSKQLDIKK